ncbi:MAG: hypothetical protein IN808_09350 [Rubrobacter sp.]|nr:hypothetical protein [Rubrobacter sp.]
MPVAAALAFASELVLLWTLPGEFAARPLSGSFVFLAAVFQGLLAASLLFGPGRWAVRLGVLVNAAILLVWGMTRLWGFPPLLGFSRLPVEPPGLAVVAVGAALLVLLLGAGRRPKGKHGRRGAR